MPHGDQKLTHLAEKNPHGDQKLTRLGKTAFSHVLVATTRVRYVLEARTHVCGAYVYVYISVLDQAQGAARVTKDNVQHMTRTHADVFMLDAPPTQLRCRRCRRQPLALLQTRQLLPQVADHYHLLRHSQLTC